MTPLDRLLSLLAEPWCAFESWVRERVGRLVDVGGRWARQTHEPRREGD